MLEQETLDLILVAPDRQSWQTHDACTCGCGRTRLRADVYQSLSLGHRVTCLIGYRLPASEHFHEKGYAAGSGSSEMLWEVAS